MRLEILETVQTPDREMVLRALEMCSREVSGKVVRFGDRITLQGLGPSPRAKNLRDTTVFCVNAENDKTIISGEVSFQASALLGDQPQGDVVRSKLEELFNQMKAQISLDEHAVLAPSALPATVAAIDASEEGFMETLAQNREPEIRSEIPAHGPAAAVSVAESELSTGSEQNVEVERIAAPEQSVAVESNLELERNVWLDELFSQLKAQVELDERLAANAGAEVTTTEIISPIAVIADSAVANDISEKESVGPVAPDRVTELVNGSSESGSAELESTAGSEECAEPEFAVQAEHDAGTEHTVKPKPHVEPDLGFDLKDNVWLEELYHLMNAQVDLDESSVAQDAIAAASIDLADPTATAGAASVSTEDLPAKEATFAVAPDREPEVMSATAESTLEDQTPVAKLEVATGSKQITEGGRPAELAQNAEVESSAEPQPNSELKQIVALEESIDTQQTAPREDSSEAVQAVKGQPSTEPGQSVWLQHVTELDLHAPRPLEVRKVVIAEDEDTPPKKRLGMWATGWVALLLVAAGSYFLYRSHFNPEVPSVQTTEQPGANTADSSPATEPPHVADTKPLLPPTRSQITDPAVQGADIRVWLENWATAMRTRDANAQAAFYADTVNEYVGKYDVSRDAVLKDREATIHMRKGLWTVKMEKVVIERQTKSEAEVRLVKHFIDEPVPSEIVESFVPTKLTLKRTAGGGWRITSEQDLPASSSAPQSR
jgi:ketosteroid isomerase-like protein